MLTLKTTSKKLLGSCAENFIGNDKQRRARINGMQARRCVNLRAG